MRLIINKTMHYFNNLKDLLFYDSEGIVPTITILLFAVFGYFFYRHGYDSDFLRNIFRWIFMCLALCTLMPWNLVHKQGKKTEEDKQIGVTTVACKIILIAEYLAVILFL